MKPKEDYNEERVWYCKDCLSLKIRYIKSIEDSEYCDDCGSTDVMLGTIKEWQNLYIEKYGKPYINKKIF